MKRFLVLFFLIFTASAMLLAGCSSTNVEKAPPPERINIDSPLIGYWRTIPNLSIAHFANVEPMDRVILQFHKNGIVDVQLEAIEYMRGAFRIIDSNRIIIKLYHWGTPEQFTYSINNEELTLISDRGKSVYKKLDVKE
jgi:PBP1b-binding outer membrane lipoprotein LpoB